ncbi:MAG TPA: hypothetical protein DCY88_33245 [Cyanobacteria bacterium UBA11372]|nr:hypothetical protein [Cyanobacteria bacterium UBA11372]
MNASISPLTVTIPLGLTAHAKAEEFRQHHYHSDKAKQVYLNTLAVYAVDVYLQYRDFETDWEHSESYDPIMQGLMNVADLLVSNYGKLECRYVLPTASFVEIPEEVWTERIGYVAVQLDSSLREAKLLGFVDSVNQKELPLNQLRSLEELPAHISQFQPLQQEPKLVNLSKWIQNSFDTGWETLEALFDSTPSELAFNFRQSPATNIERGKLLKFEQAGQQVALLVGLIPTQQSEIDISIEVYPLGTQAKLPPHLQLILFDETGTSVMQAEAGGSKSLEFQFSGEPGESFGVKVTLGDFSMTEKFII